MAPPSPDLSVFNSTSSLLSFLDLNDDQHHHHHHHHHHRHHHSMQNMENMDIELVTIADTPDRISTQINREHGQQINRGVNGVEDTQRSSVAGRSGVPNLVNKGFSNWLDRGRSNVDSPNNRRLFSRYNGNGHVLGEAQDSGQSTVDLVSPSPSKQASLCKRMVFDRVSSHPYSTEHVTLSNDRAKVDGDNSSIARLLAGDNKMQGKNKEKRDEKAQCRSKEKMNDAFSAPKRPSNTLRIGGRDLKNKTSREGNMTSDVDDDFCSSAVVGLDHGKGIDLTNGKQNTQTMSRPFQSTTFQRKQGPRRLVRNGCIAPHITAKAKCSTESHEKSYEDGKQGVVEDSIPNVRASSQLHTDSLVSRSNDTERVKGKGKMEECSAEKNVEESLHLASSVLPSPTEAIVVETGRDASSTVGGMGGWRSTRNRSNNASSLLPDGVGHLTRTNDRVARSHKTSDAVPLHRGQTSSSAEPSSGCRSEVDKKSGRHCVSSQMGRGQRKRGPTFSNVGESSTSVPDESVSLLWSSEEALNARSTRSRSNRHCGNLHQVIEIDDTPPGVQVRGSQDTSQTNDDSDARARQLEADEIMARELQEQFYHEQPVAGDGEVDEDIAWSLQHEEEAQRASSLRRQRVHPRDASMAHLYRHNHTQALQDSLVRSTSRANRGHGRRPASSRLPRLRERFLGNSPAMSSRGRSLHRSIQFQPNVDVEMRIHILEALEAAAGTTEHMMPSGFFQLQRDFNENDYEMLLALDENNHQHGGANPVQINGLPESTVQVGTVVEDCAVCLETPTIGDSIRHLPCLHKFHKDCIDPWLRRKTSCPICKSGIT